MTTNHAPIIFEALGIAAAEYEHLGQSAKAETFRAARNEINRERNELVAAVRDGVLTLTRRQATGGDLLDHQDTLREVRDRLAAALASIKE